MYLVVLELATLEKKERRKEGRKEGRKEKKEENEDFKIHFIGFFTNYTL